MERKHWTLLALAAADGQPVSPVQLQKSLFLVGENLKPEGFYEFEPYDYGPFCQAIYADVDALRAEGLAATVVRDGRSFREYVATPAGVERAKAITHEMEPRTTNYVREVVTWARRLGFQQLVRAIYRAHPEQKVNSVFRD